MHWELGEEADEVEGQEGVTGFFSVSGDGTIVAAEVARWDTIDFKLQLQGDISVWRRYENVDGTTYFVNDSFPAPMHVSRPVPSIPSQ